MKTIRSFSLLIAFLVVNQITTPLASAASISLPYQSISLNAEINPSEDKSKPFFLILHGTFAWHGMELPSTLQSLLLEEGYGSLAMTLSLNEDNRTGFFDCSHLISSKHGDAQQEISVWIKYLNDQGYNNILLIGHSRGGAQMAEFALRNPSQLSKVFLIAPMTWDKKQVHDSFNQQSKLSIDIIFDYIKTGKITQLSKQKILHCDDATITADAFRSYYQEAPQKDTPQLLSITKVATRVYLGAEDPSITDSFIAKKSFYENNSEVSYLIIEDADHYFRDFAAEDIISDIIETIEK